MADDAPVQPESSPDELVAVFAGFADELVAAFVGFARAVEDFASRLLAATSRVALLVRDALFGETEGVVWSTERRSWLRVEKRGTWGKPTRWYVVPSSRWDRWLGRYDMAVGLDPAWESP